MKIVCSSCGAKYSIADEKVEGKVFKIRCKKCSNVIMVKGTDGEDSVSDQHSADGAAEWYVVIDGEQVGPITSMEIDSYFMAGQVDAETFVWRDGLSDWAPMRELTEFGHLVQDTAGAEEKTQLSSGHAGFDQQTGNAASHFDDGDETVTMTVNEAGGFGGDDPFGAGQSDEDFSSSDTDYQDDFSGFGDQPSSQSDVEYAAQDQASDSVSDYGDSSGGFESFDSGGTAAISPSEPASSDQGGMFASFDSDSSGGDDDFLGFSSADAGSGPSLGSGPSGSSGSSSSNGANLNGDGANNMIGQRSENSVLFSLSSLDQVQAVSSSASGGAGGSAAGASGDTGADAGVTEGSGLIDIRSLASAHQSMKGGGDESETVDPFSGGTMAMPALMPMGSHRSNKGLIIAGVVVGVLFLGVAIAAIVVIATSSDKEPQTRVVEKVKYIEKEVAAATGDDSKAADEAAKAEQEALAAAEAQGDETQGDEAGEKGEEAAEKDSDESPKKPRAKRTTKRESKPAAPKPRKPARKKSGDSIDDLLQGIDKKQEESKSPPKQAAASSTKSELSKDDVGGTIRRYSGRIATCKRIQNKNNLDGTMWVKFAIRPNGRTTNVSISTGKFNGTDLGRCVQKAVQGMRFPSTSASKNVDIKYPFKL